MKFGHFCLPTYFEDVDGDVGGFMRRFVDFLVSSEDAGFDMLFANEHHFDAYGGLIPSPTVMVAALAQRTKRVRLGSSIIVLPLHSPIEIAEQWAMIDLMSNGRVELGVGRGFVEYDYDRLHVPLQGAQERLKDGVALIRKAWSGERFSHNGPHYQYENLQLWPRPQQRPHPPIWLACGGTPDSFRWAAEQGFGIFTVAYRGVQPLIPLNKIYRDAWIAAGHSPKAYKIAAHYQVVLSEDGAEARDIAAKALKRYVGATTHTMDRVRDDRSGTKPTATLGAVEQQVLDVAKMVEECRVVAGTPEDAVRLLTKAQEMMGITQVDCTFYFGGIPFELAQRSHRLFAEKVMPKMRSVG
ncbi:MAG TPA: LLM class flavin-dependent oxidoreductase [Stellaceae bacterium]|jgi:natural product biosynthesis luciferase-like monooxygenase protein|nr:LLM class flavin-dependent oxidoreductase [Stellaceae bacterium]